MTMTKTYRVNILHVCKRQKLHITIAARSSMDALRRANKLFNSSPATTLMADAEYVAYGVSP